MKTILFLILCFSLKAIAQDCEFIYRNTTSAKMQRKLLLSSELAIEDTKKLLTNVKKHLKLNKIDFEVITTDEGKFIQIFGGDGTSPIERMAKFLDNNYETMLVVDPSLTQKNNMLGYFTDIDDMPAVAIRPKDLVNLARDDYSSLLHESRHARYAYMRREGVDSIFHGDFYDVRGKNAFRLPKEKLGHYQNYMSLEEIPLHLNDLQREIYQFTKLAQKEKMAAFKIIQYDMQRLKELTSRSKVWIQKTQKIVTAPDWKRFVNAGLDDYELYLSVEMNDVRFTSKFVKPTILKKMLKLSDEKIIESSQKLLAERLKKLDDFLIAMEDDVLMMEKNIKLFSSKKISDEKFSELMKASYNRIKKLISSESHL